MPDANDITDSNSDLDQTALFEQIDAIPREIEWVDEIAGIGTIALRSDYNLHTVDLEKHFANPRRRATKVQLQDTQSFIDYARRFDYNGDPSAEGVKQTMPTVYIDRNGPVAELVVDDHSEYSPGWREHRAALQWQKTVQWKRWVVNDRKMLSQLDFAEMIEDNLEDILEPDGGDLLEIAQTVKGTMTANVKSGRYLKDGTIKAVWDEELDVTGGREADLTIPGHFVLQLQVLEEGTPITITARLRYAFRDRKLQLGYFLERPRDREIEAVNAEVQLIRAGVSPTTLVVLGRP